MNKPTQIVDNTPMKRGAARRAQKRRSRQSFLFAEAVPQDDLSPIIIDYFAGGGGASCGIEMAFGRSPDVAINHNAIALRIHELNHPATEHLVVNVRDVDPRLHFPPGRVSFAWYSPDCTHFSRAKGATPVSKRIRGLAWISLRVAAARRPEVNVLENVPEFTGWGPVRRGRPVKSKKGQTFQRFVAQWKALGYDVDWRVLDAADYGAPTHRKRFFFVARCDGLPIVWPVPTHGPGRAHPYRTAAQCIDWSIPCPSIFDRKKPLAAATQRRIAEGLRRFVLESPKPFLVRIGQQSSGGGKVKSIDAPLSTIVTKNEHCLVTPTLVQTGYGERKGQAPRALDLHQPLGTIVACGAKHALVAAFLAKHNKKTIGQPVDVPMHTLVGTNNKSVIAAHLTKFYGTSTGQEASNPAPTITATGNHIGLVAAFLVKYYGQGTGQNISEPLHTIVTKARFGLVTVTIDGEEYVITDIGLRMLTPRELARCQGFSDDYKLEGTQAQQVAVIGNSVPPDLAAAVAGANCPRSLDRPRATAAE